MTFYFIVRDLWILIISTATDNKKWANILCFFKLTHAVNLLLQKNKLCSFTNLISQKFSDTAVILALAVSKRCTQDLPAVNKQHSSTVFLFTYSLVIPEFFFFKEYFFSGKVDFGVPFSINFLSASAFLGFRKALEQDAMPSSVSVVRKILEHFLTRVKFDFLT